MIYFYIYIAGALITAAIRLISFYPKDPDRTVFTYGIAWFAIIPTLILRLAIIFGRMLIEDFLRILRDGL